MCQGLSHLSVFLHPFVVARFATTSIRVNVEPWHLRTDWGRILGEFCRHCFNNKLTQKMRVSNWGLDQDIVTRRPNWAMPKILQVYKSSFKGYNLLSCIILKAKRNISSFILVISYHLHFIFYFLLERDIFHEVMHSAIYYKSCAI